MVIRDVLFNTDAKVSYAILHVGPPFFPKITATVVENITIFGKALDNGSIRHLMRSIKNLNIGQRTVNILKSERHAMDPNHIASKKQFLRARVTEGQHNLTIRLTLDAGNTTAFDVSFL